MRQYKRGTQEDYFQKFGSDENFSIAYRKMRRIKGFYSHLKIFIIVNVIIIVANLNRDLFGRGADIYDSGLLDWRTYSTAIFWGIGLFFHGFSVFGEDLFFSHEWQQKKIQKYMDKERASFKK
ncbi:2TM domain-containing protein [Flavobacterium poyangense]|uniref:2TM domain-containing protein n=1 Tax=Flavobacterium poyangense TaxID=2204302 RepID=UPI00141F6E0D|nr:2TM domain-containing protein [Flavobacterium sp. JXAS1]